MKYVLALDQAQVCAEVVGFARSVLGDPRAVAADG